VVRRRLKLQQVRGALARLATNGPIPELDNVYVRQNHTIGY
jgi:hypothetical protein